MEAPERSPSCPICGATGRMFYTGLPDSILGVAEGTFDVARCDTPSCGSLWVHPTPPPEEVAGFYRRYFTHQASRGDVPRFVQRLVRPAWPLPGRRREIERLNAFLVEDRRAGRLLEIGCGDGSRLAHMRALGWTAIGLELDPLAAARARSEHGVEVHVGQLGDGDFPPGEFDAVVSNHVIEHLADPVGTLRHARRLLRPGGAFVAVTPNGESVGHRRFGTHWYGLDTPRHLTLFTGRSLRRALESAGYEVDALWSTACRAEQVLTRSVEARFLGRLRPAVRTPLARLAGALLQGPATALCRWRPTSGEELVVVARRPDPAVS